MPRQPPVGEARVQAGQERDEAVRHIIRTNIGMARDGGSTRAAGCVCLLRSTQSMFNTGYTAVVPNRTVAVSPSRCFSFSILQHLLPEPSFNSLGAVILAIPKPPAGSRRLTSSEHGDDTVFHYFDNY